VCIVLGGGGHARVLIDSLQASELAVVHGVLDADRALWGQTLLGVPVLGGDDLLPEMSGRGVNHFAVGLGSVGDSRVRERLFEAGLAGGLKPLTVMHPSSVCSVWAKLGAGVQLFPASVVNAGAKLGENVIVNSGAIVEHDCFIGAHTHIATGAKLSGGVHIGTGAHVGAGAVVKQDIRIGERAVIGAGACVVKDVPPGTVVVGVPARILRETDEKSAGDS
jgi:sugar O-acyltransferase (sialic acid O-acetyltransferase NeuD family)